MENMRVCCCFGHRDVVDDISNELKNAVQLAIQKGCSVFMLGGNGDFDHRFASAVRSAKRSSPHIRLILVKPRFSNIWNTYKEHYDALYDTILVPVELADVHYKSAIAARNRWMVDRSDMIIAYVHRDFGGAYTAVCYAEKQQKEIVNIGKVSKAVTEK